MGLTRREIEIVKLVCEGMENYQIASALFISYRTVKVHRVHINRKAKCSNSILLYRWAIRNGYVEPPRKEA